MTSLRFRFLIAILLTIVAVSIVLQITSTYWFYQSGKGDPWTKSICSLTGCTLINKVNEHNQNYSRYALIFSYNSTIFAAESVIVPDNTTICLSPDIICFYQKYSPQLTLTLNQPNQRLIVGRSLFCVVLLLLTTTWFVLLGLLFVKDSFYKMNHQAYTEINN